MELPSSMLPQKKKNQNSSPKNLESQFFQTLKSNLKNLKRQLHLTRVETWVSPGVPDLLICDEKGLFHFLELKVTGSNVVRLSAHQISWLTLHKKSSSWVLIRQQKPRSKISSVYLYHAEDVLSLSKQGLKSNPRLHFEYKVDWVKLFDLICPI